MQNWHNEEYCRFYKMLLTIEINASGIIFYIN